MIEEPFMKNKGHANEVEMISLIHGKYLENLPHNTQSWMKQLFGRDHGFVTAIKLNNEQKADILITLDGVKKYLSIKSGESNSFHAEQIKTFIPFLRNIGVSNKTLKTIVYYHYGDLTLNGTGPTRFSSAQLRMYHQDYFKQASEELSQAHLLKPIIERTIMQGRYDTNYQIDGVYYGTPEAGYFLHSKDILNILTRKSYRRKNGTINISMLTYQPGSRNLYRVSGGDIKREQSVIKWRSFKDDVMELKKRTKTK